MVPLFVSGRSQRQLLADHLAQRHQILGEQTDAFRELFRGHRVFVERPAECLLVERLQRLCLDVVSRKLALQLAAVLVQALPAAPG